MHYTGTIWRPPYEADSLILEATAGCTHRACKFCTLYDELPFKFKASELSTIESDLLEAQTWFHDPLSKIETRLFSLPTSKRCRVFQVLTRLPLRRSVCSRLPISFASIFRGVGQSAVSRA